jgi:Na+-driven multidrug efflux pump
MVSNVIGQDKRDLVIPLIKKIARLSFGFSIILFIPLQIFPAEILRIVQDNEPFIREGVPVLRIVAIAILLMSFSTIWLNAVTGTGNTRTNLGIEFITIILYSLYIYFVLEKWKLDITYGWMSEWLYWISMFTMSFLYIRSGKWRAKEI